MQTRYKLGTLLLGGLLGLSLAPAWAQPPEGKGPGHAPGQQREQLLRSDNRGESSRERERERDWQRQDRDSERRDYHDRREPRIDEAALRGIFREHRDWIDYDRSRDALPPGIRMNLARGKPLPPGIAKQFDPRLRSRLPYYEGYEWQRVDDKAILVDIATNNVRFILESILD
ncbi:anti-virulence regulator CigR family protein [Zobellella sp. DQSA1]|uniref:anti-virulence regulator CigR family protein n=1 Tax=Zobellella sp. DQSA1 TaxID=3342386 RepID=UPI0035C03B25